MDRELMEQILSRLPAPCSPMGERRRAAWTRLVQAVLDFCYCDEDSVPGALLALGGPQAVAAEVESEPPVSPVEVVPKHHNHMKGPRKGSPLASAVRQALTSDRSAGLSKKEVVSWLRKNKASDIAHLMNVDTSVYQCLKKLEDTGEFSSDVRDGVTIWRIKR